MRPIEIKPGAIVFLKKFSTTGQMNAPEMSFTPNVVGFGIFLGMFSQFHPDPPPPIVLQMLGKIGLVTLDDIKEFLGEHDMKDVVKQFEAKYYGEGLKKQMEKLQKPKSAKLVDLDGNALSVRKDVH